MRIVHGLRLEEFRAKHPDAQSALLAWSQYVAHAKWGSLRDVRQTYSHADSAKVASGKVVTIFNIRGNNYRLITAIDYAMGVVNVLKFMAHAEYSKEKWKRSL